MQHQRPGCRHADRLPAAQCNMEPSRQHEQIRIRGGSLFLRATETVEKSQRGRPMPVRHSQSRSNLPAAERQARSQLVQLLSSGQGMIRGTLSIRERSCGKQTCRCTSGGPKHASLYLVVGNDGKYKQFCVPRSLEAEVRIWVAQYHRAQELLEEISQSYWHKILNRE